MEYLYGNIFIEILKSYSSGMAIYISFFFFFNFIYHLRFYQILSSAASTYWQQHFVAFAFNSKPSSEAWKRFFISKAILLSCPPLV